MPYGKRIAAEDVAFVAVAAPTMWAQVKAWFASRHKD